MGDLRHDPDEFSPEQRDLWRRVEELWALARERDESRIRSALHARYVGWDMSSSAPHDREAAVRSVSAGAAQINKYGLRPLSVQIYDERIGVVHYTYSAKVTGRDGSTIVVTGKWSEVYLKEGAKWTMISVSGRPDTSGVPDGRHPQN